MPMNRKFTLIYYATNLEQPNGMCLDVFRFLEEEQKWRQAFSAMKQMTVKSPEIKVLKKLKSF